MMTSPLQDSWLSLSDFMTVFICNTDIKELLDLGEIFQLSIHSLTSFSTEFSQLMLPMYVRTYVQMHVYLFMKGLLPLATICYEFSSFFFFSLSRIIIKHCTVIKYQMTMKSSSQTKE